MPGQVAPPGTRNFGVLAYRRGTQGYFCSCSSSLPSCARVDIEAVEARRGSVAGHAITAVRTLSLDFQSSKRVIISIYNRVDLGECALERTCYMSAMPALSGKCRVALTSPSLPATQNLSSTTADFDRSGCVVLIVLFKCLHATTVAWTTKCSPTLDWLDKQAQQRRSYGNCHSACINGRDAITTSYA